MKTSYRQLNLSLMAMLIIWTCFYIYFIFRSSHSSSKLVEISAIADAIHSLYQAERDVYEVKAVTSSNHVLIWYHAHRDAESLLKNYRWTYRHAVQIFAQLQPRQTLAIIMDDLNQLSKLSSEIDSLMEDMISLWKHIQQRSGYLNRQVAFTLLSSCINQKNALCDQPLLSYLSKLELQALSLDESTVDDAWAQRCIRLLNARKYDSACTPQPKRISSILITGLGGSGSHYVSNLLRWMQIDVQHESLGQDGSVAWMYAVNDVVGGQSYPHHSSIPNSSLWSPRFRHVLHLTRCPLQQIASLTTHLDASYNFIFYYLRLWANDHDQIKALLLRYPSLLSSAKRCERQSNCNLHRAMVAWIAWTYLLNSNTDSRMTVNAPADILSHVCQLLVDEDRATAILSLSYGQCQWYLSASSTERAVKIKHAEKDISIALSCAASRKKQNPWRIFQHLWHRNRSPLSHPLGLRSSDVPFEPEPVKSCVMMDDWSRGYRDSATAHHKHPNLSQEDLHAQDPYLTLLIVDLAHQLGYQPLC
jgi:hypothetical protein